MNRIKNVSKVVNDWSIAFNPLKGLTQSQINMLLSNMRLGNDVRIQVAFAEIERQMPIFGICINKRCSAIINKKWEIFPIDDSSEAVNQAKLFKNIIEDSDSKNVDGFTSAIKHLALAPFRGRSCVKPFLVDNKLIFKKIQNWNTLAFNDKLYWNPSGDQSIIVDEHGEFTVDLQELSEDEVMFVFDERPIDIPGLQIYLRQIIGEDNWARFVEKSGVPQVIITAPEGTSTDQLQDWQIRATQIFEGASGTLSYGSDVKLLTDGRGQDPFSEYVNHQMEMICLLALGEKLTTLGGSTGLGSNLAEIQSAEFMSLVNADAKSIQNTINACLIKKLANNFKQKVLCQFKFVEQDRITPNEYLEMALKLNSMGIAIDVAKLKELTNIPFISDNVDNVWTINSNEKEIEK